MRKHFVRVTAAWLSALAVLTSSVSSLNLGNPEMIVSAAETGSRILVDLSKNDGRTAAHASYAHNWIVTGETSASTTINGVQIELSAGGGSLRMEDNKKLHKYSNEYSRLNCDAATVDTNGGGTLTLKLSGLSNGTHSVKTYHAATGSESAGGISVSASGGTSMSGISCPQQVLADDDAGIGYVTFSGTSATITIKASSGNAWLNAFEIDGGDPINGVNHTYPLDQDQHWEQENGLYWSAGKNAKSYDVYFGTDYDSVFGATTGSSEYMGNQTSTKYAFEEKLISPAPYYWRVDTIDSSGKVIKGSVYSFHAARLAFPTAEGYGRFARGGQDGYVYHVTNLKDDGQEGSLRYGIETLKGPRIIVFDVGGIIELEKKLTIPGDGGDLYVAGQTAPGDGICLTKWGFGMLGAEDVIIRDVRVRVGDRGLSGQNDVSDGMGLTSSNHSIIDHCSIAWGTDEGFSSRNAQNVTLQWTIIAESLHDSIHYGPNHQGTETHAFAASISGYTGSFHHNLLVDCTGRNWSLAGGMEQDAITYGGQCDIRNNVVYNWRDRTTDGGVRRVNFVNNYYKAGAASNTGLHIIAVDGNELNTNDMQKAYVSGNIMTDYSGNQILKATDNAWDKGKAKSGGKNSTNSDVRSDTPFFESYVDTQSAEDAYKSVIASAGAGGTSETGWDYLDSRYIKETKEGTYTYKGSKQGIEGIIDSQNDAGGYPNSTTFAHSTDGMCNSKNDTDRDGMPNAWEAAHGLNPNDAADGAICTLSADGYTNVEMFLNELMGDPVAYNGNGGSSLKKGAAFDTAYKYEIADASNGSLLENVKRWAFTEIGNGYYQLTDADTGEMLSETEGYKFVRKGDSYTIYTQSSEDTVVFGGEETTWTVTRLLDPIDGKLIHNLVPTDETYYASWSIDESLAAGDRVFGDRVGENLVTYETIPASMLGAEFILTPCDAKKETTDLATFEAAANMTVYIGFDSRVTTLPEWMSAFAKTDMTIINSKDVVFDLYAKDVKQGETVVLGQNGQSSGCVNYTVFAVASGSRVIGDVNADGKFTESDVVMLHKWLICSPNATLTDWKAGDLCEDSKINAADLSLMKRELLKQN